MHNKPIIFFLFLMFVASCSRIDATDSGNFSYSKTPYTIDSPTIQTQSPITADKETTTEASPPVVSVTSTPLDSENNQSYIGLRIPPIPKGLELIASTMIMDGNDYILNLMKTDKNSLMIWLTENRGASEKVLAILPLPKLEKDEIIATNYCQINGREDPEVIAVGLLDESAYEKRFLENKKIRMAWRANRLTRLFEPINSLEGIECSAEWGFDPDGLINK
mgnify:CR=1 FL=1